MHAATGRGASAALEVGDEVLDGWKNAGDAEDEFGNSFSSVLLLCSWSGPE